MHAAPVCLPSWPQNWVQWPSSNSGEVRGSTKGPAGPAISNFLLNFTIAVTVVIHENLCHQRYPVNICSCEGLGGSLPTLMQRVHFTATTPARS